LQIGHLALQIENWDCVESSAFPEAAMRLADFEPGREKPLMFGEGF
jgi:hypothetical protein